MRLLSKGVCEEVGEADGWWKYLGVRIDRNEGDSGGRWARCEQLYTHHCRTEEHIGGMIVGLQVPFWICGVGGQLNMARALQRSLG